MEFRTKREAEEAIRDLEQRAAMAERAALRARERGNAHVMLAQADRQTKLVAETARIRALLPTLKE